jgi:hypothetical protein
MSDTTIHTAPPPRPVLEGEVLDPTAHDLARRRLARTETGKRLLDEAKRKGTKIPTDYLDMQFDQDAAYILASFLISAEPGSHSHAKDMQRLQGELAALDAQKKRRLYTAHAVPEKPTLATKLSALFSRLNPS